MQTVCTSMAGDSVSHNAMTGPDLECAVMRRSYILIAMCLALAALASPAQPQGPERFKVRLATVPMDGGMRNTVAGFGSATATLTGAKLSVTGTFDGLKSAATTAKLNAGLARGVRGD